MVVGPGKGTGSRKAGTLNGPFRWVLSSGGDGPQPRGCRAEPTLLSSRQARICQRNVIGSYLWTLTQRNGGRDVPFTHRNAAHLRVGYTRYSWTTRFHPSQIKPAAKPCSERRGKKTQQTKCLITFQYINLSDCSRLTADIPPSLLHKD